MSSARMIYFADVYCPWCYAFAPSIRKLASQYPDIPVSVVGGSLISEPTSLPWLRMRETGLDQFWSSAQEETGRPFNGALEALAAQKDVRMDSIGADALFIALSQLAPGNELAQFTEFESMFFEHGIDLFTAETLEKLAAQWRVNANELATLASDPAMRDKAIQEMQAVARMLGGRAAFPTVFVIRGNQEETVSQGYVHYETVAARMEDVLKDLRLEPLAPHDKMSRLF